MYGLDLVLNWNKLLGLLQEADVLENVGAADNLVRQANHIEGFSAYILRRTPHIEWLTLRLYGLSSPPLVRWLPSV